jgi:glycosyltransferase involved in cell wall biosynthesis
MPANPLEPVPPQASVIVPCWNAAASIERALGSVLAERDIPLECVVVDDGSTDGTVDLVRAIAARDPGRAARVTVNEGCPPPTAACRPRGVAAFLDADDRLLRRPRGDAPGAVSTGALAVVGQRTWSDGTAPWITHLRPARHRVPGRSPWPATRA